MGNWDEKSKLEGISGVYAIISEPLQGVYVGESINIGSRWRQHKWGLNKGTSEIKGLQSAWPLYKDTFKLIILEQVKDKNKDILLTREYFYIKYYKSFGYDVYNRMLIYDNTIVNTDKKFEACLKKANEVLSNGLISPEDFMQQLNNLT